VDPQLPPQLPITTPICSYMYICIFKMPLEKGKEWNYVRVFELKDKHTSTCAVHGGVQVPQACLCRWCIPHQGALISNYYTLIQLVG